MSDNASPPTIHPGGALSCPVCGDHRFYLTVNVPRSVLKLECGNMDCVYFAEVNAGDNWPHPLEIR